MLNKKVFTVSIGEFGIIIALHENKVVQSKILLAALNEENKSQLKEIFDKDSSAPIYVLLDTIDQNYKKKTYPPVNESDFRKMAKRDLAKDNAAGERFFSNYSGVRDKLTKKWESTFVFASYSEEIEKFIVFLLEMTNKLDGICMLPIESYNMAQAIFLLNKQKNSKKRDNTKNAEKSILSLMVYNKVSGVRQIVFFGQSVVLTRIIDYDFNSPQFIKQFEQDIFRSNEYLRMAFPNTKARDVSLINVLPEVAIEKINQIHNPDLNFINYSPYDIADKFGLKNAVPKKDGDFSDIIIANFFVNNKKLLKFFNKQTTFLKKIYQIVFGAFIANIILGLILVGFIVSIVVNFYGNDKNIEELAKNRIQLEQKLQVINSAALGSDVDNKNSDLANQIIDFGKIYELFSKNNFDIAQLFSKMRFIRHYDSTINTFVYNLVDYKSGAQSFSDKSKMNFTGTISDVSGDIEVLFKKFDALNLETKKKFPEYVIKYSDPPKDIDFGKKYYSFPFTLTLESKSK